MLSTCLEDGRNEIGLDGIFECEISRVFVVYLWKIRRSLGETQKEESLRERERAREWERHTRAHTQRERIEFLEKKKERTKERKKERHPQCCPPFQRTNNRIVHWEYNGLLLILMFTAKGRQKKVFSEREREASSLHHWQPLLPFRGKAVGLCTESTKACGLCFLFRRVFRPCGDEWLFPSGNRVCGQYQGLSMTSTIMLLSFTGTLELECGTSIKASEWIPRSRCPPSLVP